jgi:hypothetical protein
MKDGRISNPTPKPEIEYSGSMEAKMKLAF